jgi:hypothetical protein
VAAGPATIGAGAAAAPGVIPLLGPRGTGAGCSRPLALSCGGALPLSDPTGGVDRMGGPGVRCCHEAGPGGFA